jgi:MFS transporter, OFA family, oxalate/formate antiporter
MLSHFNKTLPAKGRITLVASFFIMLCLGGIYTWSVFVPELKAVYGFSTSQTQLVFGMVIAIFPITMILAGKFLKGLTPSQTGLLSAAFFFSGNMMSGFSAGNFYIILTGTGVLAGIGTGLGYLVALTTPVKWFPSRKGLVTGIAAAGFGLAPVILSAIVDYFFEMGIGVLRVFVFVAIAYGAAIALVSFFIKAPAENNQQPDARAREFLRTKKFYKIAAGIFMGTFAGLLVIGNLHQIGAEHLIDNHILIIGVSVFALANFLGRMLWGFISDYLGAETCIVISLFFQAIAILLLGTLELTAQSYLSLSFFAGFGFGSNFVLFARHTSQSFGLRSFGYVYSYIFLGYAIAGIMGPVTGGAIYDLLGNFRMATLIAAVFSMSGAVIFIPALGKRKS